MGQIPDDLPVVEHDVVRLVVPDVRTHVLLLHTHDPTYPEHGTWWELPGGGIEDEDYFGFRWWPVADVVDAADVIYPGRLRSLRPDFLAGKGDRRAFRGLVLTAR